MSYVLDFDKDSLIGMDYDLLKIVRGPLKWSPLSPGDQMTNWKSGLISSSHQNAYFVRSNKAVLCFDQCHYRHTTLNIWENNFQEKVNCFSKSTPLWDCTSSSRGGHDIPQERMDVGNQGKWVPSREKEIYFTPLKTNTKISNEVKMGRICDCWRRRTS